MGKKLFVIPHDGSFRGDNIFQCPPCHDIPYRDGMTIKHVRAAIRSQGSKQGVGFCAENPDDPDSLLYQEIKECVGAWVVDQRTLRACQAVWPPDGCGHDGAVYSCNRSAKHVADELCVKTIGRKAR